MRACFIHPYHAHHTNQNANLTVADHTQNADNNDNNTDHHNWRLADYDHPNRYTLAGHQASNAGNQKSTICHEPI